VIGWSQNSAYFSVNLSEPEMEIFRSDLTECQPIIFSGKGSAAIFNAKPSQFDEFF
jgi:hypothetical protein